MAVNFATAPSASEQRRMSLIKIGRRNTPRNLSADDSEGQVRQRPDPQ